MGSRGLLEHILAARQAELNGTSPDSDAHARLRADIETLQEQLEHWREVTTRVEAALEQGRGYIGMEDTQRRLYLSLTAFNKKQVGPLLAEAEAAARTEGYDDIGFLFADFGATSSQFIDEWSRRGLSTVMPPERIVASLRANRFFEKKQAFVDELSRFKDLGIAKLLLVHGSFGRGEVLPPMFRDFFETIADIGLEPGAVFDTDIGDPNIDQIELIDELGQPKVIDLALRRKTLDAVRAELAGHKAPATHLLTQLLYDPHRFYDNLDMLQINRPVMAAVTPMLDFVFDTPYTARSNPPVFRGKPTLDAWSTANVLLTMYLTRGILELGDVREIYTRLLLTRTAGIRQHATTVRLIQSVLKGQLLELPNTVQDAPDLLNQRDIESNFARFLAMPLDDLEMFVEQFFAFNEP